MLIVMPAGKVNGLVVIVLQGDVRVYLFWVESTCLASCKSTDEDVKNGRETSSTGNSRVMILLLAVQSMSEISRRGPTD